MKRILVTGVLGSNLVRRLYEEGLESKNFTFIEHDIINPIPKSIECEQFYYASFTW